MDNTTRTLIVLFLGAASLTAEAETNGYVEFSAVLREHSYDLDITVDGARFHIDERYRSGWMLQGGWSVATNWSVFANFSKHDTDNADGIIRTQSTRGQAPISYKYQRASLGIQNHRPVTETLWLDTSISYQRTEQGIGNFFIESGTIALGLNRVDKDAGATAEIALRNIHGNWEFELLAGYDPHAGFKIGVSDVSVESSYYGGLSAQYHIADQWNLGLSATTGKVTDVAFTLGVTF